MELPDYNLPPTNINAFSDSTVGKHWQPSEYGGDPEFQIAMHAIGNCAYQALYDILLEKSFLVHRKGWSGHTLLHRASMVGDYNVVQLLLQTGADPNATNDYEETPLLYACRRGLVSVLHLMIQYRGNVGVIDKNGRGPAHHAVLSGSVAILHYLTNILHVSVAEPDHQQQTPLHIVCENGHYEAFRFLLRDSRSNLSHQDANGNTALHIAARQCYGPLCWQLLERGGVKQLSVMNRDGQIPVTLCRVNAKPGRAELLPQLDKLSRPGVESLPRPMLYWYWLWVKPALIFAAIVSLVNACTQTYSTLYMIVPLGWLLRSLLRESHRMNHLCRWPNPVHAGLFAAGIFHTFLLYVAKIVPVLVTNSHKGLVVFSALLIVISLYHYIKLLIMDPGVVKANGSQECGDNSSIIDICHATGKPDDFCTDCEIVREGLTKHCKLCTACFINMDHHCLFLMKCIAKYNHRCFVIFLLLMSVSIVTFIWNVVCYGLHRYVKLSDAVSHVALHDGWLASLFLCNVGVLFWMIGYTMFQIRLIANGSPAFFTPPANARPITMKDRIRNVVRFIIEGRFLVQNSIQTI